MTPRPPGWISSIPRGFASRRQPLCRNAQLKQHRICRLSTSLPGGIPAPTLAALPSNSRVGALVSRRQWKRLFQEPSRNPSSSNGNDGSEKPWPRSVQFLGYGLATTVVPFCIAWYIATNVTIRHFLEPYVPGMIPVLRKLFGDPEEESISYVDKREDKEHFVMPLSLVSEPNTQRRREQEELEELVKGTSKINTRLRVYTHGGFNLGQVVDMPGAAPVTREGLLQVLMEDRNQSIDPESVSHVTVEFGNVCDQDNAGVDTNRADDSSLAVSSYAPSTTSSDNLVTVAGSRSGDDTDPNLSARVVNLTKTAETFSSWHCQPAVSSALVQPETGASGSSSSSNNKKDSGSTRMTPDDIRSAELNYEIQILQGQLKDHTTMRNLDDITQELEQAKSELRRLRWKKRLRVFG